MTTESTVPSRVPRRSSGQLEPRPGKADDAGGELRAKEGSAEFVQGGTCCRWLHTGI